MNSASIRIALADDHRIVREGIKQMVAEDARLQVVAEAASGEELLQQLKSMALPPQVLLLDIALPGIDGLEVLAALRQQHPSIAVLVLSTYPERQYSARCIKLGAVGYLNKSADADVLLEAVHTLAGGGMYINANTAQALASAVGAAGKQTGSAEILSHREHQVYRLLVAGHSVGQIGASLGLASNTVSTYRARILEKTGTKNDVELALWAERQGKTRV